MPRSPDIGGPLKSTEGRDLCKEFLEMCEDMEDYGRKLEETADGNQHQIGFGKGYRKAAKSIRNAIAEAFREYRADDWDERYGH